MTRYLFLLCGALAAVMRPAGAVLLVENGEPRCTIVVPREEQRILDAAEDLQYHLRRMSGAEVPLVHDPNQVDGVGLYIDTKPLNMHVPGRLLTRQQLWPDGYVIEIIAGEGPAGVFLSSPVPEGVSHAVYGLLEDHLGCHWYTPGEIGEYIPQRSTVQLELPGGRELARPSYELRAPWYDGNVTDQFTREEVRALNLWYRRNRRGGPRGSQGHGWGNIYKPEVIDAIDEDGDGISDLRPFFNGRRQPVGGLCLSHPQCVEIAADWFIKFFNAHPEYDHWSFTQSDSPEWCRCDRCLAMGSNDAARMLIMSNRVVEKLNRVHPHKRITISPYKETREPPEEFIPAHPNLIPVLTSLGVGQIQPRTADHPGAADYRRQVERWMTMLPRAWVYDYVGWYNGPWPQFHALQENRDFYRRVGCTGVMTEYLSRNVGTDLHLWLSLRMAWDAHLRVDDLLEEFYPNYFGAAAEEMRWVYERFEERMIAVGDDSGEVMDAARYYPPELVEEALVRIARAKEQVEKDPTRIARIERDENGLRAVQKWLRFLAALARLNRGEGDRQEAAQAVQDYLDFIHRLQGALTLSGRAKQVAERLQEGLTGPGTVFTEPGPFRYWDNLDLGGKMYHARSHSGFHIGPYGLYLKPGRTGEIIYDFRAGEGLHFQEVYLPGGPGGWDSAIRLALPPGGHNKVQVSLDQGKTWITFLEDFENRGDVVKFDLTDLVGGSSRFWLKFWVQNTDQEILALDTWVIVGTIE